MDTAAHLDDTQVVTALLGRVPQGAFEVVVRDLDGSPVVLRNAPFLDDGTPMPTRYWLVGRRHAAAVGRLEADGGVRRAEAEIAPEAIAAAHQRYADERDAAIPAHHVGPRPSGGVGGTRTGVKCLHAHLAWHLAGGDDPVGAWTAARITLAPMSTELHLTIEPHRVCARVGAHRVELPLGLDLVRSTACGVDPPAPIDLTNAIGLVTDHLDDLVRELPDSVGVERVLLHAPVARAVAAVEVGGVPTWPFTLGRDAAEDVFRTVATEPAAARALNPGLPADQVGDIVAGCCAVVAVMRRLQLDELDIDGLDTDELDTDELDPDGSLP